MFGHKIFLPGRLPRAQFGNLRGVSYYRSSKLVTLKIYESNCRASNCKIALSDHTFVTDSFEKRADFRITHEPHLIRRWTEQKLLKARLS